MCRPSECQAKYLKRQRRQSAPYQGRPNVKHFFPHGGAESYFPALLLSQVSDLVMSDLVQATTSRAMSWSIPCPPCRWSRSSA